MLNSNTVDALQQCQPKLIFFDIDGTLLNTEGNYSVELEQQLHRLQQKGVKLAIASGRPSIAAQFLFDTLPLTDAGLFCTGAELYEPKKKKHLKLHLLDKAVVEPLYKSVKDRGLYCEFYTPDYYAVDAIDSSCLSKQDIDDIRQIHSHHLRVNPQSISGEIAINKNLPITKLLLGANEKKQGKKLKPLVNEFPQLEFAFAHFLARPDWLFASVVHQNADKNQGFQTLLDYHQVTSDEVIAFGDSHSDITFLKQAGLGVAMGNASDHVKSSADIVTLSSDNNGVAEALKYIC